MHWFNLHSAVSLTYSFLLLSLTWMYLPYAKRVPLWQVSVLLAVGFALSAHLMMPIALLPLLALSALIQQQQNAPRHPLSGIRLLLIALISVGLELHQFPGFHPYKALDHVLLSSHSTAYTLHLYVDKPVMGLLLLAWLQQQKITGKYTLARTINCTLYTTLGLFVLLASVGLATHYIGFAPKWPDQLPLWLGAALLSAMAEEALFRGLIQGKLSALCAYIRLDTRFAILGSALLFGLRHYYAGTLYMLFAVVAGIAYGWVYHRTKRITASISTHVLFNLCHLLVFTYPALQVLPTPT